MPPFVFVFLVHGGYHTTLSYDDVHDVFVLFTFAKVESDLVWYFVLRLNVSITLRSAY